jgi:hypothetical protein
VLSAIELQGEVFSQTMISPPGVYRGLGPVDVRDAVPFEARCRAGAGETTPRIGRNDLP